MKRRLRPAGLILVIAAIATACGPSVGGGNSAGIRVVAAENFYGDVAQQIGGSHVQVTSVLSDPNVDPHEYESNARDAKAVAQAKLVIHNGAGYDPFMEKLLAGSPRSDRRVINVAQVAGVAKGANPHIWYRLGLLEQVASLLADRFAELDPAHRDAFSEALVAFNKRFEPVTEQLKAIKAKYGGVTVLPTEQVANYLLEAAGLQPMHGAFQRAIEEGNDPPAQAVQEFEGLLTSHRARLLVYNAQTESKVTSRMRQIAEQAGVPVVAVRETMPPGTHAQEWLLQTITAIRDALAKST